MVDRLRSDTERGFIIPIGGAEEKMSDAAILRRFVGLTQADFATAIEISMHTRR